MGSRSKPKRETRKPKKDKKPETIAGLESYTPEVEVIRKARKPRETSEDDEE